MLRVLRRNLREEMKRPVPVLEGTHLTVGTHPTIASANEIRHRAEGRA